MKTSIRLSYNRFVNFLRESPKYNLYDTVLRMEQLTPDKVLAYTEYLKSHGKGIGPHGLYGRFKKVVTAAFDDGLIKKNPCMGISIKWDKNSFEKDILSPDEIKQLIATRYEGEIRRYSGHSFSVFSQVCAGAMSGR